MEIEIPWSVEKAVEQARHALLYDINPEEVMRRSRREQEYRLGMSDTPRVREAGPWVPESQRPPFPANGD